MLTRNANAENARRWLPVRQCLTRCELMRYFAACLCQLAMLVCMAPLPSTGSEEQPGGVEEGIAKMLQRRSSPEIASRQRPASRIAIVPNRSSLSAERAALAESRHPVVGHLLPNGLLAPLRC